MYDKQVFPFEIMGDNGMKIRSKGMSLKDHFAGIAMKGLFSWTIVNDEDMQDTARMAYKMAAAMMEERDRLETAKYGR